MPQPYDPVSATQARPTNIPNILSRAMISWPLISLFLILTSFIIIAATFFSHLDSSTFKSFRNDNVIVELEKLGVGLLVGPEDLAYDSGSGLIYTGCADGWIKRVKVNESNSNVTVDNWVNTGGRPLGLAFGHNKEVIVADPQKGLLNVSRNGKVRLLTDQAEGVKFRLTDSVDVAKDGMVYFTDSSYKYGLSEFTLDFLEGKPHGRLLSFNPKTKRTRVLVRDLYFANGVAVSPDQNSIVFCETVMMRCRKYYRRGKRNGTVTGFIDNLPGLPDNIRYDGKGNYWIALATAPIHSYWELVLMRYSLVGKWVSMAMKKKKYVGVREDLINKGGVLKVDTKGNRTDHLINPELSLISSGKKIGNYLYCGSLFYSYIIRIHLQNHTHLNKLIVDIDSKPKKKNTMYI